MCVGLRCRNGRFHVKQWVRAARRRPAWRPQWGSLLERIGQVPRANRPPPYANVSRETMRNARHPHSSPPPTVRHRGRRSTAAQDSSSARHNGIGLKTLEIGRKNGRAESLDAAGGWLLWHFRATKSGLQRHFDRGRSAFGAKQNAPCDRPGRTSHKGRAAANLNCRRSLAPRVHRECG